MPFGRIQFVIWHAAEDPQQLIMPFEGRTRRARNTHLAGIRIRIGRSRSTGVLLIVNQGTGMATGQSFGKNSPVMGSFQKCSATL